MSRGVLLICLASIAALGLASAAELATAASAPTTSSAFAPVSDGAIGNTDDGSGGNEGDDALAAPVGGPVPAGVFPSTLDGPTPGPGGSRASRVGVSASIAVAAMIGHFF